jgi:UDP-N-acetylmuramate dehydrogenase
MPSALDIRENVTLAPFTTLKVGGPAKYFVEAASEETLSAAMRLVKSSNAKFLILGGGSNLLIADAGFDGYVIHVALKGTRFDEHTNYCHVTAAAGEDWDEFVGECVKKDLAGVECLSGIPGSVGGTPVQNVGAYGQDVSQTILAVRCFDRISNKIVELDNASCRFAYRRSIFNFIERERYVVLSVTFALKKNASPKLSYADLKERFEGTKPTVADVRKAVLEIRRSKSMVIDESDPNSRSAGSFFKNPELTHEEFAELSELAAAEKLGEVPSFASSKKRKVPAAWLIEKAGFHKGYKLGKAGISENHALAIINLGDAKASDIIELKDKIQTAVRDKFSVELVPEPVFVGFDD